jgi:hypothetical protein
VIGASVHAQDANSTLVHAFAFSDGASIGGSSRDGTLYFLPGRTAGSESVLERANVTGNNATQRGAAVFFHSCDSIRFQYCEIRSNAGSNCITIWEVITRPVPVRCISVRWNTADDRYRYQGLFYISGDLTISESAIAGNSTPFLLHGLSQLCTITFSDCHFDSFSQNATVANFSTVNCATDAAEFPGLPAVYLSRTRTPTGSRSPPPSASPSAPLFPSLWLPRTAVLRFSAPILLSPPGFALSSLANSNPPSQSVNFLCYRSDGFSDSSVPPKSAPLRIHRPRKPTPRERDELLS